MTFLNIIILFSFSFLWQNSWNFKNYITDVITCDCEAYIWMLSKVKAYNWQWSLTFLNNYFFFSFLWYNSWNFRSNITDVITYNYWKVYINCLEHKPGKCIAASQWQKVITDVLIICQLYSIVMGEKHVLNRFVLQAVNYESSQRWRLITVTGYWHS